MARKSRKRLNGAVPVNGAAGKAEKAVLFRAGLYARLSYESGVNRERGTIETQMELMRGFVEGTEDIVVQETYSDASFTGTTFERPGFERMMGDIRNGKINCVIVKDLSRLGRNYVEAGNYIERVFPFLDVRFISVNDGFDSFRSGTDLSMPLKNIVNEYYAKDISRKVTSALNTARAEGKFVIKLAPYGYLKSPEDKQSLVVDGETAGVVKRIFRLFLEGNGYGRIAGILNGEGIPCPEVYRKSRGLPVTGHKGCVEWTGIVVKRLLSNEYYTGDSVHGKTGGKLFAGGSGGAEDSAGYVVRDTHEALVSRADFDRVQEMKAEQARVYNGKRAEGRRCAAGRNKFKKKVVCSDCGKTMYLFRAVSQEGDRFFYGCSSHNRSRKVCPYRHKVMLEDLEAAVFGVIRSHMDACLDAERLVRKLNAGRQGMERYRLMSRQADRIRERIRQAAGKKAGLYADFAERLIDGEEYAALSERYTKEAEALSAELERLLEERERYERDFHIEEGWEKTVRGFLGERELTQGMVDAFVTRVSVDKDGDCEVVLAYDDMLAELLEAVREREAENGEG